jgi:hypothetical protein
MENVPDANRPFVIMTRIGLLGFLLFLSLMIWIVWKRRPEEVDKA